MVNFDMQVIGVKLQKARTKAGFSQNNIAMYLGINQALISKYENGTRPISMDALDKLSDLFRCSLDYFILESVDNTPLESFALRAENINGEDLKTIAKINRVIVQLQEMEQILDECKNES